MSEYPFDAIVVGSGFGGSVSAYRLAEAGLRVCVLERGRAYPPNSFPRSPHRLRQNVWDPSAGLYGMFNFWTFRKIEAVISSGLGGGSLIYANVLLRKDERWFVREDPHDGTYERWPVSYRDLEPHYEAAERMLGAQPFPLDHPPYDATARTHAFRAAAERAGLEWQLPNLAITFANEGRPPAPGEAIVERWPNYHGRSRQTCVLCGECVLGCNSGSKNTLDHNYLSAAKHLGADIRPLSEVRALAPRPGGGYRVHYVRHDPPDGDWPRPQDTSRLPLETLEAPLVVLGAGTLGSTYLLLKNRPAFPGLSSHLGSRFNGNGDLYAAARRAKRDDGTPLVLDPGHAPAITSAVRVPDVLDGGRVRGHYVEDCGYPEHLSWALEAMGAPGIARRTLKLVARRLRERLSGDRRSDMSADVAALLGDTVGSATSMPLLGMGRDVPDGRMFLRRGRLEVDWRLDASRAYFEDLTASMRTLAEAMNARFSTNPTFWLDRVVTVHPLGGCPMGEHAATGVVDDHGEVFGYPGLFVADGAVMPGPVGPNPSLTIAALADRFAERMIQRHRSAATYPAFPPPAVALDTPVEETAPMSDHPLGLHFTETMNGYFSTAEHSDFAAGARRGETEGSVLAFTLTVHTDDLDRLLADPRHVAGLRGTVTAPALSPAPLAVTDGQFELFVTDADDPAGERRMWYRFPMTDERGRTYFLVGTKRIRDDAGLDMWPDTTTLYTTVHDGDSAEAPVLGCGILYIGVAEFRNQLQTMTVLNARDERERLGGLARFGHFFGGQLFDLYGGVFARPTVFDPGAPPRQKRPLRAPIPSVHAIRADDGVPLRLTRYEGGRKGPVLLVHGLGVSSLAFAIDTIDTNLVEYLVGHDYDVWLLDNRSSIELPSAATPHSADDIARRDWPAAVAAVREITGAASVQAIGHCYGALTFTMAMLAGLQGVRAAVCSQVGAHVNVLPSRRIRAGLYVTDFMTALGVDDLTMYTDAHADWLDRLMDKALRLYPTAAEERCDSLVCHRVTFLYAPLYEHDQLNNATHDVLHELFGVAAMDNLNHLGRMIRAGHVVAADGGDDYLPHVARLAIPLLFLHGAENQTWIPESTERTVEWLRAHNDPGLYRRRLIPDYGHIDCIFGRDAARDVYPHVLEHLEGTG